jgi:uncharacterized protein YfaQ (DUF2300 family)
VTAAAEEEAEVQKTPVQRQTPVQRRTTVQKQTTVQRQMPEQTQTTVQRQTPEEARTQEMGWKMRRNPLLVISQDLTYYSPRYQTY